MFEREINPNGITNADIAVGLASYNEADSISHPTRQADLGLRQYFPELKPVIINCDNHSPDNTAKAFLETETEVGKIYITTPPDTPGKGYNFENMFRKACELGVKVLICVDADLRSITPEWIKYFGQAIMQGYDYATPIYSRHKYDGTITNNICYPLVYGLLGQKIRQPIGGDFALSQQVYQHFLKQMWHRTTKQYGIDIFMTLHAILGGYRIAEVGLGAKIHKPSAPKLGPMFFQVVNTAFWLLGKHWHRWQNIRHVQECPLFGLRNMALPQELEIDKEKIRRQALVEYRQSEDILANFLAPQLYQEINAIFASGELEHFNASLWQQAVYDMITVFAVAEDKAQVVEALRGLYFGRVVAFMNQTREMTSAEAETVITAQAELFFTGRNRLIKILAQTSEE